jgi:hypothetical protein
VVLVRSKVNFKNKTGKNSDGYRNVNNIKYNENCLESEMSKYLKQYSPQLIKLPLKKTCKLKHNSLTIGWEHRKIS